MAHQQKYYKEIDSNGIRWRVEIWQDTDEAIVPTEIGPVLQGLRLVIQGDQADVDTPIVKTSLEMQFVDAPGLEYERKCGYWEEFYTSSATEYQVRLYKDGEIEWTGYITPDSFSEDLRYRGSVSIIARDNLGTLQDTTCDLTVIQNADGKVRISTLIGRAVRAISTCAMELEINDEDFPSSWMLDSRYEMSNNLMWQMVDTKQLHEGNWWEALEKVLYSIGACIRFVGGNKLKLIPIRNLPKCGQQYWQDVEVKDVNFLAYGHRELVPGVKSIAEKHEFEINTEQDPERINQYNGTATRSVNGIILEGPNNYTGSIYNVPAWGYTNPRTKSTVVASNSNLLNVNGYPRLKGEDSEAWGAWEDESIIYYLVNAIDNKSVIFSRRIFSTNSKVSVYVDVNKPVTLTSDYSRVLNLPIEDVSSYGISPFLQYRLKFTDFTGQTTQYYNSSSKQWQTASVNNTEQLSVTLFANDSPTTQTITIGELQLQTTGTIELEILAIHIQGISMTLRHDCVGMYMRLSNIRFDVELPEDIKLMSKLTLTTEYSDKYSVRLNREPEFAINATELPEVAYVPNAILAEGAEQYYGVDKFAWHDWHKKDYGISLARLIHQQLLAYYAEPNNLLTGELVDRERGALPLNAIYTWNGKPHMLISGKLNILNGRIEGATLRGFTRYDHMWETWVENEDIVVDYPQTSVKLTIHSNKELSSDMWKNLPDWIAPLGTASTSSGLWESNLICKRNEGEERVAYIMIDTAVVKVTQRSMGDYNIDYGQDYS